jgi:MFS family permease
LSASSSEDVAFWIPFLAAVAIACLTSASPDTYWHLRAGQDIAVTGHVSLVDHYSYTATGNEWPDHEWLWQLASFGAFSLGGMPLLTALGAALAVAALLLARRLAIGPWWTCGPLFMLTVPLVLSRLGSIRPQAFTLLALMSVVALIAHRRLWPLPLLFLLWANTHGAVVLGFFPLGVGVLVALARRERRLAGALVVAAVVCAAATLATPLGLRLYSFIGESMERSRINDVGEWRSATDLLGRFVLYLVLAAALVIAAVRLWRRLPSFEDQLIVGTAVLFAPLAVRAVRNIGPFTLLAFPAATRLLAVTKSPRIAALSQALRSALEDEAGMEPAALARRSRAQIAGCALLVAGLVSVAWVQRPSFLDWSPVSEQARASIASCPGQVFNAYDTGGYLVWFVPEKPVFVDSRQDPYPVSFLTETNLLADSAVARAATFKKYGIRCAALDPRSRTISQLLASGWRERYRDERWVVLWE